MSPEPMWPVCWKFVGSPIWLRSMRGRRGGGGFNIQASEEREVEDEKVKKRGKNKLEGIQVGDKKNKKNNKRRKKKVDSKLLITHIHESASSKF